MEAVRSELAELKQSIADLADRMGQPGKPHGKRKPRASKLSEAD
jgi:hypothetical protein